MLTKNPFYYGIIRKCIVAFGAIFSDLYIQRRQGDSVTGDILQELQIPISYAPKEKWLVRLDSDPSLENHTYTSLPRISFEITGYSYDSSRKNNRNHSITCGSGDNTMTSIQSPVPYNIDIALYVLTKTQEDAMQIIEQILPFFQPEYSMTINAIPEMNLIQNIPVILNNVSVMDEYEGDFQTRRFVTHTLDFTLKTNIFGALSSGGVITTVNANTPNSASTYSATGNPATGLVTSESWTVNL